MLLKLVAMVNMLHNEWQDVEAIVSVIDVDQAWSMEGVLRWRSTAV